MPLRTCPTCGSKRLRRRTIDLEMTIKGRTKTVRGLELEICPDCGEKLFDAQAHSKVHKAFATAGRKAALGRS